MQSASSGDPFNALGYDEESACDVVYQEVSQGDELFRVSIPAEEFNKSN
jgi:hypothetical protein